jgi:hypothetical protein
MVSAVRRATSQKAWALRHRNMSVTRSNYIRQDKSELVAAMKPLEENGKG